ncbi:MAG TPA: hypothetical protein VG345_05280 [Bryobacteraceae bacterium]|nr:hypothetical protein [Bryobacteraceae bacterium]
MIPHPTRKARASPEWRILVAVAGAIAAALVVYSQTAAFAWDEGFHMLTAQLIAHGRRVWLDFMFPQTPLNVFWNAILLRAFGYANWRAIHTAAALETAAAVLLAADFVFTRFPVARWRLAAAIATAALFGLNVAVFEFGPIGQAYALCLLCIVAAFRLAIIRVDGGHWTVAALCGLCACAAPAASLLTAPFAPIFLGWMLMRERGRRRILTAAAFCVGGIIPFLPPAWLFVQAPGLVKFNVLDFNLFYRRVLWRGEEQIRHDLGVAFLWVDSAHALLLLALFLAGMYAIRRERPPDSTWPRETPPDSTWRRDLSLSAVCALVEACWLLAARPTFGRYYLLVVPFLAIPASFGLYWLAGRLSNRGIRWAPVAATVALLTLGLGKMILEEDSYSWADLEDLAAKVNQVSPPGTRICADEHMYFLLDRTPPPGMEHANAHKLILNASDTARLQIIPSAELDRQIQSGAFGTYESCDDDEIDRLGVNKLFRHEEDVSECSVYWQPVR